MSIYTIDHKTMQRLTLYLHYLQSFPKNANIDISREIIAENLQMNPKVVRKDLEMLCPSAKPTGYNVGELIHSIGQYIYCPHVTPVVLVGVGKLGKALMSYAGFTVFELDVLAGFDVNPDVIRKGVCGKSVYPMEKLKTTCKRLGAHIGIITVPGGCAQAVCDMLIDAGVLAIWNFTSTRLVVPEHIMVINEDMSETLVRLSEHVTKNHAEK